VSINKWRPLASPEAVVKADAPNDLGAEMAD